MTSAVFMALEVLRRTPEDSAGQGGTLIARTPAASAAFPKSQPGVEGVCVCVCVCVCARVQWTRGLVLQEPGSQTGCLQVVSAPREAGAVSRSLLGADQAVEAEDGLAFLQLLAFW